MRGKAGVVRRDSESVRTGGPREDAAQERHEGEVKEVAHGWLLDGGLLGGWRNDHGGDQGVQKSVWFEQRRRVEVLPTPFELMTGMKRPIRFRTHVDRG